MTSPNRFQTRGSVATKMAALATRAEPRDLIDIAAILDHYTRAQLIDLAHAATPVVSPLSDDDLRRNQPSPLLASVSAHSKSDRSTITVWHTARTHRIGST